MPDIAARLGRSVDEVQQRWWNELSTGLALEQSASQAPDASRGHW